MFTAVHRSRFFLILLCAFVYLPAPQLRAQEAELPTDLVPVQQLTASSSDDAVSAPVYPLEGIPGGDAVVGDFVVGPGKLDLTLTPGTEQVVEMTVTNRTGERRIFNLTVEDAQGSNDLETPVVLLGTDRGPYSLRDYISFAAPSFELGHNQRARIPITISIPVDAEPGGLYGSVLVDTVAIEAISGETQNTVPQSAIIARIGTLFFVTIPGEIARSGGVTDFGTIPPKKFYESGPINFGILFENTGSMHLAPYGEVRITNMFGSEVGAVQLDPWFVFPFSKRLREVSWERELLFGQYTATVQINRSYDDIIDTKTYSFWILPWKMVLGGFVVTFVILFIIRAFFRSFAFEFKRKSK